MASLPFSADPHTFSGMIAHRFPFIGRRFFAGLLLGLVAGLGFAEGIGEDPPTLWEEAGYLEPAPDIVSGELENGLRYYIKENTEPQNRAALRLVVNAGSILENPDQLGLAHFLEHMAFNGTENFDRQEIVNYLESIGMQFGPDVNAYTSFDETVYMLELPTDDEDIVENGFRILEEWAHRIAFEQEEIDKERGVVIEEWRVGLGADTRIRDEQLPVLLRDSRYAERLPIGDPEIIADFERPTLLSFYEDWYRPDLMAVVAVGDFDASEIEEQIRSRFSGLQNPVDAPEREVYEVPPHEQTLYVASSDPELPYTSVTLYNKADMRGEPTIEGYRNLILNRLYGIMINARFEELARSEEAPFLFAGSGRTRLVRTEGAYYLNAVVEDDAVSPALSALVREARRVQEFGFTEAELERAKRQIMASMERTYNERNTINSNAFADEYIRNFLDNEPIPGIAREWELHQDLVPDITLEDLNELAESYLTEENRVVTVSMVDRGDNEPPSRDELASAIDRGMRAEIAAYTEDDEDRPLIETLPQPGSVVEERTIDAVDVVEWRLSNGARVFLKPTDFRNDEVRFSAVSLGGTSTVENEDFWSATYASNLVQTSGLGSFSRTELDRRFQGINASVSPYIDRVTEGMGGSSTPGDLEHLMQLTHLYFTEPRSDEAAFENYIRRLRGLISNRNEQPSNVFSDAVGSALWDDDFRSQPLTVDRLDQIDYERALEIYRDRFSDASNFTFFFVGNIDLEETRALVEQYLASLPEGDPEDSFVDRGRRYADGVVQRTVRSGIEPQSFAAVIFNGEYDHSREANYRLRSLAAALRIRMREVLREDEGGTYGVGVGASVAQYPWERYIMQVVFGTSPERVEELVALVFEEIRSIAEEGLDESYLTRVTETQRRSFEEGLRQNGFWLSNLESLHLAERDFSEINRYVDMVDALTLEDLRQAAQEYLDFERYIRVILLPEQVE